MTTSCEQARGMVQERLDDNLPARQQAWLDSHLLACEPCRRELAWLRFSISAMERLADPELSSGFAARVLAHAKNQVRARTTHRSVWIAGLATSLAATLVLALWTGWVGPVFDQTLAQLPHLAQASGALAAGAWLRALVCLTGIGSLLVDVLAALAREALHAWGPTYGAALAVMLTLTVLIAAKKPAALLPDWRNL
jgi:anti-sigma factor RsiW